MKCQSQKQMRALIHSGTRYGKRVLFLVLVLLVTDTVRGERTLPSPTDRIQTENGVVEIYPVNHATFVMRWNGQTIFIDPVGPAERFQSFARPDLILITDIHGDHHQQGTVSMVRQESTITLAPQAVIDKVPTSLQSAYRVLGNGEKISINGMRVEAIPMYNLTKERLRFHSKGRGNGYVVSLGGKRVYISGDTEDVPEMRSLKNIDVAFLCMNLPYTMTVEQAASAAVEFKPGIVFPYHYRGTKGFSDINHFKKLVQAETKEIEVRIREWYAPSE